MSGNLFNQVPFVRTSRTFPTDPQALSVEIDRAYIDLANNLNQRIIGLFAKNKPCINGESWFINQNQRQQGIRQVYSFTGAGNIAHGLNLAQIPSFTRIYGTFTDGTNWYPLPYVDVANANNQVNVYVSPTNIVITSGAGTPPSITSGLVVLEWLDQFQNKNTVA
jgi:hypothetical protein